MTDFTDRLDLYKDAGMLTEKEVDDVFRVLDLFKNEYEVVLCEENAEFFIAHLSAALHRNDSGEEVIPMPEEAMNQLRDEPHFSLSETILNQIIARVETEIRKEEYGYLLLHLCALIAKLTEQGEWK
ncbi:MAG: PRD domain-containing protein [Erysipelotrichaceae bacterium]|nr:PRD domain-containing protein [Erysipelotrichaceae bacterium]